MTQRLATISVAPIQHASLSGVLRRSKDDTSRFDGVQIIQGIVVSHLRVRWKFYGEPRSNSGIPRRVRLMAVVQSDDSFRSGVSSFNATVSDWRHLCQPRPVVAQPEKPYPVKSSDEIKRKVWQAREKRMKTFLKLVEQHADGTLEIFKSVEADLRNLLTSEKIRKMIERGAFAEPIFAAAYGTFRACEDWAKPWGSYNNRKTVDFATVQNSLAQVMAATMAQFDCQGQGEDLESAKDMLETSKIVKGCHQCISKSSMRYDVNNALKRYCQTMVAPVTTFASEYCLHHAIDTVALTTVKCRAIRQPSTN